MIIPSDTLQLVLNHWPIARLATVTPSGRPHAVPVVFCLSDDAVWSPQDGKRKTGSRMQRHANIAERPLATLLIDHYDDDWQTLWWLRLDAAADVRRPAADRRDRIRRALADKYPQYLDPSLRGDLDTFVRLRIERVTGWTQSGELDIIDRTVRARARPSA